MTRPYPNEEGFRDACRGEQEPCPQEPYPFLAGVLSIRKSMILMMLIYSRGEEKSDLTDKFEALLTKAI